MGLFSLNHTKQRCAYLALYYAAVWRWCKAPKVFKTDIFVFCWLKHFLLPAQFSRTMLCFLFECYTLLLHTGAELTVIYWHDPTLKYPRYHFNTVRRPSDTWLQSVWTILCIYCTKRLYKEHRRYPNTHLKALQALLEDQRRPKTVKDFPPQSPDVPPRPFSTFLCSSLTQLAETLLVGTCSHTGTPEWLLVCFFSAVFGWNATRKTTLTAK